MSDDERQREPKGRSMSREENVNGPRSEDVFQRFGYRQEFRRELKRFASFAVVFSIISITTGIFTTYGSVLNWGGPLGVWTWPIVVLGQGLVALVFAALAARIPLAGYSYQWASRLANPVVGWLIGWVAFTFLIVAIVSVDYSLAQTVLPGLLNYTATAGNAWLITALVIRVQMALILFSTFWSTRINNMAAGTEIIGIVGLTVLLVIVGAVRGVLHPDHLFSMGAIPARGYFRLGTLTSAGPFVLSFLIGVYTITGFEAAANLAEETEHAHRVVPFAMLSAVLLSGVIGMAFLIALNLASGDLRALAASATPVADIVTHTLGRVVGDIFLVLVTFSIFACGLVAFMTATRLVWAMAWSPDGHLLASSGPDPMILLWDVEQSSYRTALHGHTAYVHDLTFTPESRNLLSGGEDGTLRVWDVERGHCVRIMQGYAVSLNDVDWSPDGTRLASAGTDTLVTIWESASKTPPRLLTGHRLNVTGVTWSPDGKLVASSGWDNAVRVWDASTGEARQLLRDPDYLDNIFLCAAWSPDGKFLVSGSIQQGVQVWDVATGSCRWVGRTDAPLRIRRVKWSPDGTRLVSWGDDGRVFIWAASDGTLLQRFDGHRGMVMSVAWSSDGARLASGSGERGQGKIFVWDVRSGERLYSLNEPSEVIYALAWSSNAEVLISGGSDGSLRWWEIRHRERIKVIKAHNGAVQSLKLSPDGGRLASCGDEGAIHIWDMESGERLETLRRDRPYERLNISGVKGLTQAQRATLQALGAVEDATFGP